MGTFTTLNNHIKRIIDTVFFKTGDPLSHARLKNGIILALNNYLSKHADDELVPDKFIISVIPSIYRERENELEGITNRLKKEIAKYYIDNDLTLKKSNVDLEFREDFTLGKDRVRILPAVMEEKFIPTILKANNYILEVVYGLENPVKWFLEAGKVYVFGRDENCDCVIIKNNVSRQHFRLIIDDEGSVLIEDLNSANGTYLNENPKKISGKVKVNAGDMVQLCKNDPVLIRINKE